MKELKVKLKAMKQIKSAVVLCALMSSPMLAAEPLAQSQRVESQAIDAAKRSQDTIDQSSDRAFELQREIEILMQEVESLEVYRDHLSRMIDSQQLEIDSFHQQLDEIGATRQGVVPLMYRMLAALETHIENDRPIRPAARAQRLEQLNAMMAQADVSDAEKYRRILEAYQIELDYGSKLGSYQGELEVAGERLQVEQLYLGRAVLLARSLDQQQYWTWDQASGQWQAMDRAAGLKADQAYALARQSVAPSLLELPVSLKEAQQ